MRIAKLGTRPKGGSPQDNLKEGGQTTEERRFKPLNIEQQNNEPQNDEVITSIFEIPCSIFYGSKKRQLR